MFAQSIQQDADPDLPATENATIRNDDTGVRQRKAIKMNAIAMCNFTMLLTTEALMGLIYKLITTNWPSRQTNIIVVLLYKKYLPKDL
eukprot:1763020-Ditylum_brightwellii.AAC.1